MPALQVRPAPQRRLPPLACASHASRRQNLPGVKPRVPKPTGWAVIDEFLDTDMSLLQAYAALATRLGEDYREDEWKPVIDAVTNAKGDSEAAHAAVDKLRPGVETAALPDAPAIVQLAVTEETAAAEKNLMKKVSELKKRNRLFGDLPTIEDLVDPLDERYDGDEEYIFPDGDEEILAEAVHNDEVARNVTCTSRRQRVQSRSRLKGKGKEKAARVIELDD